MQRREQLRHRAGQLWPRTARPSDSAIVATHVVRRIGSSSDPRSRSSFSLRTSPRSARASCPSAGPYQLRSLRLPVATSQRLLLPVWRNRACPCAIAESSRYTSIRRLHRYEVRRRATAGSHRRGAGLHRAGDADDTTCRGLRRLWPPATGDRACHISIASAPDQPCNALSSNAVRLTESSEPAERHGLGSHRSSGGARPGRVSAMRFRWRGEEGADGSARPRRERSLRARRR